MITVEIINDKNLPESYAVLMNKWRKIEFNDPKHFRKDYPNADFFFVKDHGKIVAFGTLRPITIKYLGKTYKIMGFCNIITIEKGKGYGKIIVKTMINYLKEKGKTGLGFCRRAQLPFYEKSGLKTKKDFIKRFVYRDPITKEEIKDNEGDGLYYNGKDGFVKKVLSTKSTVYINIPHW